MCFQNLKILTLQKIKRWWFENKLKSTNFKHTTGQSKMQIAILLPYKDEAEMTLLQRYLEKHHSKMADVSMLIYKPIKSETAIPNTYFLNEILWHGIPQSAEVTKFLSKEYDLFYNLVESNFEMHQEFIIKKMAAKTRVGLNHEGYEPYFDLMLDIKSHDLMSQMRQIDMMMNTLKLKKYNE